ncbi:hypothetical protein BKA70DRAFT_1421726 [Coprinopsis sp. MPI-PUGE-AT-0042]|nr:hypothetical protein BKA70DRAFT_1421726 [Coprinopsis sp. MPI-PUGE-AT-0042]
MDMIKELETVTNDSEIGRDPDAIANPKLLKACNVIIESGSENVHGNNGVGFKQEQTNTGPRRVQLPEVQLIVDSGNDKWYSPAFSFSHIYHNMTNRRNRQSLADLEDKIDAVFSAHKDSFLEDGQPSIPGHALVECLRRLVDDEKRILDDEDIEHWAKFVEEHPDVIVNKAVLLGFLAARTQTTPPPESPEIDDKQLPDLPQTPEDDDDEADYQSVERALQLDDLDMTISQRRSPNELSDGPYSRPPSRGVPATPSSAKSPFDAAQRQRQLPAGKAMPRLIKEQSGPSTNRLQAKHKQGTKSKVGRPPIQLRPTLHLRLTLTAPHSHQCIRPAPTRDLPLGKQAASRLSNTVPPMTTAIQSQDDGPSYNTHRTRWQVYHLKNLPWSEEQRPDASARGRAVGCFNGRLRSVLRRCKSRTGELQRKKNEAEELLHRKVSEHEIEGEELRSKELLSRPDVTKINKQLEHSKHHVYQLAEASTKKQIAHAERLDTTFPTAKTRFVLSKSLCTSPNSIGTRLNVNGSRLEEHVSSLEQEKQEKPLLKETIDRLRYDMDELRNNISAANTLTRKGSVIGSVSKSLGAELAKVDWDLPEEGQEEGSGDQQKRDRDEEEEGTMVGDGDVVAVESIEENDGEDVIETIITRKRFAKKVPGQNGVKRTEHKEFIEAKEYADFAAQHEPSEFCISRHAQTEPEPKIITASFSTQTESVALSEFSMQTEEEKPRLVTMSIEIQTDPVEESVQTSRSPSPTPVEIDSLASSSSTVVPATPKALPSKTLPGVEESDLPEASSSGSLDQPPAYHDHNWAVVSDVLKKWHNGAKIPVPADGGIEGGAVSEELVEEWKALKDELGVECMVIDKIIANSKVTPGPRASTFYNIYNTYVFGDKAGPGASSKTLPASLQLGANLLTQAALVAGCSALVMIAAAPYLADATAYSIPGGATYYDRSAWASFNTLSAAGEGFSMGGGDGTDAVWSILGRVVGGGVARVARGWPT